MFKKIRLHSVRAYLKLSMFFYFKKIEVHGTDFIPKESPVLFLCNHQNALLDPLVIAISNKRFLYFLTRAGVFKSTFVAKLLKRLQMIPVYRIRDGWSNLTNNASVFKTCSDLLGKQEAILIFPEGNHNLKRTVRPLSKGFARIVFETLEQHPEIDLQLIPVGINYTHAEKFPDSVSLFFGEAIPAKNFVAKDKNKAIVNLKNRIQLEISKLTTHIPPENYEDTLNTLNKLQVDFLDPLSVNKTLSSNFKFVERVEKTNFKFKPFFVAVLAILLCLPYVLWKFIVQPKIEHVEFKSTFRFAIAITLVPIWILALAYTLMVYFGWFIGVMYFFAVLAVAWVVVKT